MMGPTKVRKDMSKLDTRFGTMLHTAVLRGKSYVARQELRHRGTGEVKVGWFFFWYGEQLAVCLVNPSRYNFDLPFGEQEDLLYKWEPHETEPHT